MDNSWDKHASWTFLPDYGDTRNPGSIVLFRLQFRLPSQLSAFSISVTADTRYRLFLNGYCISVGSCKGTPSHFGYQIEP